MDFTVTWEPGLYQLPGTLNNPMGNQTAKREEKLKAIKALANVPLQNYFLKITMTSHLPNDPHDWGFTRTRFFQWCLLC